MSFQRDCLSTAILAVIELDDEKAPENLSDEEMS